MRVKRGKDSYWHPIKFKGDGAIYARCKCGFYYPCYSTNTWLNIFKIEIDFSKCSQLNGMIGNPINKDNSLDYDINKTLKVSIEGLEPNNSYYWYIAMISAIAFLLLPLAKEDNNEI